MKRRTNNRQLKKRLRLREKALGKYLSLFLDGFNPEQSLEAGSDNFRLLLSLRWLVYDYIYFRLKLDPRWAKKLWFLDLFDVDRIKIANEDVELTGDIVWWAEGKDALGEWWPADHEPYRTAPYKKKMRGDLSGGYWVLEPVIAKLRQPTSPKRNARYEIEFGRGSTYMKIISKH